MLSDRRSEWIEEVHIFWLQGMSCEGCTVAMTSAMNPSVEQLMRGVIPDVPPVQLHHPSLADASGEQLMEPFRRAAEGRIGAPYVVVLEGSVPDDQALGVGAGYYAALGAGGTQRERAEDELVRVSEWLKRLAPGAAACMAIGTCASFGGIPAAAGNITGSMSLMDFLGAGYRSARGLPVINVPGCAPIGDNFNETLSVLLQFFQNRGPQPEFDELGRPAWQFGETVHHHCTKAGYYEEGTFAHHFGDEECLVHLGCWGPVVQCNITERGAINHMGGCMRTGGACIGCTMPGFPDKYAPFYKRAPGSNVSGAVSTSYGSVIRRLRRLSIASGNREPLWDQLEDNSSPWAREYGKRSTAQKVETQWYKRMQYKGTANHYERYKKQPIPVSLDILRKEGIDLNEPTHVLGEHLKSRDEIH